MLYFIKTDLKNLADPEKAKFYPKYFKSGKGEYGKGDKFIGVTVPNQRRIAKKYYQDTSFDDIKKLLNSDIHEHRFTATEILNIKYLKTKDNVTKNKIVNFYLANLGGINNWDLVDNTAYKLLGDWLLDRDKRILYVFAGDKNLWKRRISIVATMAFIRQYKLEDTFKIAKILLKDEHDLIQKAVGWLLREAGKKDQKRFVNFLNKHYKNMPRTMLRYAIEKFPEDERQRYLKAKI